MMHGPRPARSRVAGVVAGRTETLEHSAWHQKAEECAIRHAAGWINAPRPTKRRGPSPLHFQSIARWGACRKTRVVPHNRRLDPESTGNGGQQVRVLLSTYGSRGDVEPMVGFAGALRSLGAEVRVCAPPDFADLLARVGEIGRASCRERGAGWAGVG